MYLYPKAIEVTKPGGAIAQWVRENKLNPTMCSLFISTVGGTLADIASLTIKDGDGVPITLPTLEHILAFANRNDGDILYTSTMTEVRLDFYPDLEVFEAAVAVKDIEEIILDVSAGAGGDSWTIAQGIPSVEPKTRVRLVSTGQNFAGAKDEIVAKGKVVGMTKSIMIVPTNFDRLRINDPAQRFVLRNQELLAHARSHRYLDVAASPAVIGIDFDPNMDKDGRLNSTAELIADMGAADTNPVVYEQYVE